MIKEVIKRWIHAAGFDLHRLSSNPSFQLVRALNHFHVDLVLDVGANVGQFASGLRELGYGGNIVSFEPLADAHVRLVSATARDARWQAHSRCAVGDRDGEIQINVAGNSVSSSILPMLESHRRAAKESAFVGTELVPLAKIDTIAPQYLGMARQTFLKIDTQGFEWQVLDGARETLPRVRGVSCELSVVPLYEGHRLWLEVMQRLEGEGFTLWSIQNAFANPPDGRALQVDAVFFRLGDDRKVG